MNIDFMILDFIQKHMRCEMLDAVMPVITALGNGGIIWIAMTAILLCFPKTRRLGAGMAVSLALEVIQGLPLPPRRPFTLERAAGGYQQGYWRSLWAFQDCIFMCTIRQTFWEERSLE